MKKNTHTHTHTYLCTYKSTKITQIKSMALKSAVFVFQFNNGTSFKSALFVLNVTSIILQRVSTGVVIRLRLNNKIKMFNYTFFYKKI